MNVLTPVEQLKIVLESDPATVELCMKYADKLRTSRFDRKYMFDEGWVVTGRHNWRSHFATYVLPNQSIETKSRILSKYAKQIFERWESEKNANIHAVL